MEKQLLYTVYAITWFDKVNGNTYHSARCIRHADSAVCVGQFQYGYGSHFEATAIIAMANSGWIDAKYIKRPFLFERENNYPINWIVTKGTKRECVANGQL